MNKRKTTFIILATLIIWIVIHLPGLFYGIQDVPLHASYLTSDEQSPINGALHVLEDRSLFGLRNLHTLYYGPVFAVIALPAVVADFATRFATGVISGANSYKDFVVFNWGGILGWARLIAILAGYLGLLAVYKLFKTKTFNPAGWKWIPWISALILGGNFMYFEYSNTFRHWIFILALLLWQIYLIVKNTEDTETQKRYWIFQMLLTVLSFGISYLSVVYQVIWIPLLVKWIREKDYSRLKGFAWYILSSIVGALLIFWWHPYGFIRILGIAGIIAPQTSLGQILDLTPAIAGHSFVFYLKVIWNNNFCLIFAGLVSLFALMKEKISVNKFWLWILLTPAVINYIIFSIPTHHESRYVLPSIVLLLILVTVLFSHLYYHPQIKTKVLQVVAILIGFGILLNIIQIVGWQRIMIAGPLERQSIIPQIISWQKIKPDAKTLVFQGWPLGYVHTKLAYQDFVSKYEKGDSDLWKYILSLPEPKSVVPLNVYYDHSNLASTTLDLKKFDHIVVQNPPHVDPDITAGSPQDIFDLNPLAVWNYQDYLGSYKIMK